MTRFRPTPSNIPVENSPVRERRVTSGGKQFWLACLAIACCCTASTESSAGDPCLAEAQWYAPYTPEGNCAPYKRTYGYTRTRWHKWPSLSKPAQEPETVSTPRPVAPPAEPSDDNSEDLPEPDSSKMPERAIEPGPNPDDLDTPPVPPAGPDPAVPPGVNDDTAKPSQDLDDLFPDETPAPKQGSKDGSKDESMDESEGDPKATPGETPEGEESETDDASPDAKSEDDMSQGRRGGGRRTSFNSSSADPKMHWRRSSRLAPSGTSEARTSGDDRRAAPSGHGATQSPWQEVTPTTSAARSASNPLRGTRTVLPAGATQSQSLADTNVVPAVADWSAAPGGNPLRAGQ